MDILKRMSRTLTEVGPTLRKELRTLFRDEQRRRLTTGRPESRLASLGGSGLTHMVKWLVGWLKEGRKEGKFV